MNKLFEELFEGFNKSQEIAREISKSNDPDKIDSKVASEEQEIEYTCCNIEITDEIRDNDRCPKCLENL